jgi:hypothetical protein
VLFCLEFSKEDTKAAEFEFRSISHSDPQFQEHWTNHNGSVFHGDVSLYRSMAFVRKIGAVLFSFHKLEELKNCKLPEGKYYVRKIKLGSPDEDFTESMIGEHLQSEGRISFKTPDFVILAFYADMWYICKQEFVKNRKDLESRKGPDEAFFFSCYIASKVCQVYGKYFRYKKRRYDTRSILRHWWHSFRGADSWAERYRE